MIRRIYEVRIPATKTRRLVRATSRATAIRYAAEDTITAQVATQEALIELLTAGAAVEDAGLAPEGAA
jgi:hypothetical protein